MSEIRIRKLQNILSKQKLKALLITSTYNISYLTGIFAFSSEEREARILVTKQSVYLFTDARYLGMVKNLSYLNLVEISSKQTFVKTLNEVLEKEKIKSLCFEEENITYKEIADIEEEIVNVELLPTSDIVENLREIKDKNEIEKIKKACTLTDLAFKFILKYLKPGVTEIEAKARLESFIRENGGELSFESIIAFGSNSAIPHHLSINQKLEKNDIILLDFGAKVENYTSDMTRTVFLGKPNQNFEKIYKETLKAQEIAINYLNTHNDKNFKTKQISDLANESLKGAGFKPIPHAIGHGVGLQVYENPIISPFTKGKLKSEMVVTIEPGIYIPNLGGVRIEDTIVITEDEVDILTKSSKEFLTL